MPPVLRDPSVGLDCTETPFRPPKTLSRNDVAICSSCNLYFSATIVGPKDLIAQDKGGILFNESPLIQIEYNNNTYGLSKTYFWRQGVHRDFKTDTNYDMELNLYFRDIYSPDKLLAVAIPVTIDDARGLPYFSEINTGVRTITMDTIISKDAPVLVYKGIDLQGRDSDKKQTASQCSSPTSNLTWFVFPTTFIKSADANRIRQFALPESNTAPFPDHEITLERARQMCMIIPKILLKIDKVSESVKQDVFLTRALQCQRIDPLKDVKEGAVYLNGPPTSNLSSELDDAANLNKSIEGGPKNSFRAKQIEEIMALVIGITIGIILLGVVTYYIFTTVYKGYVSTVVKDEVALAAVKPLCKPPILF